MAEATTERPLHERDAVDVLGERCEAESRTRRGKRREFSAERTTERTRILVTAKYDGKFWTVRYRERADRVTVWSCDVSATSETLAAAESVVRGALGLLSSTLRARAGGSHA